MREHKYKAWDKRTKQWIAEGFNIIGEVTMFNLVEGWLYENKGPDITMLERIGDVEIVQWTGQLDKNKKEIYEGDICNIELWDGSRYENLPVVYDPSQAQYFYRSKNWDFSMYCEREVIGNIYENPELIQ